MSIFLGENRHYPNAVKSLAINLSPNDKKEKRVLKLVKNVENVWKTLDTWPRNDHYDVIVFFGQNKMALGLDDM